MCHRLEHIEARAEEGDEDSLAVGEVAELPISGDGDLCWGEVKPVTRFL